MTYLIPHCLTTTGVLQPFGDLQSEFVEEQLARYSYKPGFLDAPTFVPTGYTYQWLDEDEEIHWATGLIDYRG